MANEMTCLPGFPEVCIMKLRLYCMVLYYFIKLSAYQYTSVGLLYVLCEATLLLVLG